MLPVYIFAAIVGGSLLALGMLGGEGGPDEFEGLQLDGELDLAGDGVDSSWKKAFSMRSAAYFLAGFGITGLLLTLIETGAALTFGLAVGMGVLAATMIVLLFGWLRGSEGGFATPSDSYIGAVGQVRVPIRGETPGSVQIEHRGRSLTMRARALGQTDSDPSEWRRVLVVDVDDRQGILLVQPVEAFLADGEGSPPVSSDS